MSLVLTAPGVYIQEIPSGSRAVTGVATSITAFVGAASRGPVDEPTLCESWSDYQRRFGGLWVHSPMSQAVRHFFLNGGSQALVVRVVNGDSMLLQASAALVTALPSMVSLVATVSASDAAAGTFTLTLEAFDESEASLGASAATPVDLAATPEVTIAAMQIGGVDAVSVVAVCDDPPPDGTFSSYLATTGTITLEVGTGAQTAGQTLEVGFVAVQATATAQALTDFDHLELVVTNSDAGAGTFDLEVRAIDGSSGTIVADSAVGVVAADPTAAIEALVDGAGDPLVSVVGLASAGVPADGSWESSADADGNHTALVGRASTVSIDGSDASFRLEAAAPGAWGNQVRASVSYTDAAAGSFHLVLSSVDADGKVVGQEVYYSVSLDEDAPRWLGRILERQSSLARLANTGDGAVIPAPYEDMPLSGGLDGEEPRISGDIVGSEADREGIYALLDADIFNLLCVPLASWSRSDDAETVLWPAAIALCEAERAFLIMDPPDDWDNVTTATSEVSTFALRSNNAAMVYPRIRSADPLQENRLATFPPCGVAAGIYARTDAGRGVWKAPAGIEASARAVTQLTVKLTDGQQGTLNNAGVDAFRTFPVYGTVLWGARTLNGADVLASEWKYVPVRRLALYLEESLYRGVQWAVFEPNDEPLWGQLRMSIGSFMQGLFRQGAFAGSSPKEAWFVKCDRETTTQADIDLGIVNVIIGFAPLKPAEFVIIQLQQLVGQAG